MHDVAHIPAQHEWSVHALHTWFASPAELTLLDALCGTFDVWNTQHPDASYMQYQITDDRITSVAMTPIKTRLLNISSSGAVFRWIATAPLQRTLSSTRFGTS